MKKHILICIFTVLFFLAMFLTFYNIKTNQDGNNTSFDKLASNLKQETIAYKKNLEQKILFYKNDSDAETNLEKLYLEKDKIYRDDEKILLNSREDSFSQYDIAQSFIKIGNGYFKIGQNIEAEKLLYKSSKIINKFNNSVSEMNRIDIYYSLAISFHEIKKYSEALKYYKLTLNTYNKFHKEEFLDKYYIYLAIGMCLNKQKEYSEACKYIKDSIEIASDDLAKAQSLYALGTILNKQKKYNKAIAYYNKSLNILLNSPNIDPLHIVNNYRCKAEALESDGKTSQAIQDMRKALKYTKNEKLIIIINKQIEKWTKK